MKPGTLHMLCSVGILLIGLYARGMIRMKQLVTVITMGTLAVGVAVASETLREKTSTGLGIAVDASGRITELSGAGVNRLHPDESGFIITIREYEKDGEYWKVSGQTLVPKRMVPIVGARGKDKVWGIEFDNDAAVSVRIENRGRYLRLEIVEATSPAGIAVVNWGPYPTTLHDTVGRYLGVVRSKDFAIGALSLGIGTDGNDRAACFCDGEKPGGMLTLSTIDHTRPVRYNYGHFISAPAKEAGTVGGAIALWGVADPTKDRELDLVEEIVRAEGLPYPTIDGVWAKKSPRANESAFWVNYDDTSIDAWIKAARVTGIRVLSRYNCFGNWGHFEPDPVAFKAGWEGLKTCSDKARAHGIRTTAYTLSTFTRAFRLPEPFIAPKLDPRFNRYVDTTTTLTRALPGPEGVKTRDTFNYVFWADPPLPAGVADNEIRLAKNPKTFSLFVINAEIVDEKVKSLGNRPTPRRFLDIDGELVVYRTAATNDTEVVLGDCERGFYGSTIRAHPVGTRVTRLDGYDHYDSLMPGTDEMIGEVAVNIAAAAKRGGMENIILDGVECADRSGNGNYSVNRFIRTIFDHLPKENVTFVGSRMTHYTWHIFTTQSWGEHDLKRGIRGSQLETRLQHQLDLRRNNYPNKLGQYYPDSCSLEDIDWIMAFAAGHDAGVDFQFGLPKTYEKCERIRLWEDARRAGAFTESEKRLMRQTDTLWELKREGGKFTLSFVRRWKGDRFEELPASAAPVKALGTGTAVMPRSIDREWVHASGQCERWCITDDLTAGVSAKPVDFEVTSPVDNRKWAMTVPLFVMRVPENSSPVVNPVAHYCWGNRRSKIRIKTTLASGEYVTIPHRVSLATVYNARHELLREVDLEDIPRASFAKGDTVGVSFTSDNTEPVPLRVNLRFIESSLDGE